MWEQIAAQKAAWIGGTLKDSGDSADRMLGFSPSSTRIKDITFDGQWFEVVGEDFSCGGDRSVLGIVGCRDAECKRLHLSGILSHSWEIERP